MRRASSPGRHRAAPAPYRSTSSGTETRRRPSVTRSRRGRATTRRASTCSSTAWPRPSAPSPTTAPTTARDETVALRDSFAQRGPLNRDRQLGEAHDGSPVPDRAGNAEALLEPGAGELRAPEAVRVAQVRVRADDLHLLGREVLARERAHASDRRLLEQEA